MQLRERVAKIALDAGERVAVHGLHVGGMARS
jgi:hypothetical protein